MLDALWPATLGYFLRQMMAPDVTDAMTQALRAWARANVRGRGPYPAFRVGRLRTACLPVGPLFRWPGDASVDRSERRAARCISAPPPIWLGRCPGRAQVGRSAIRRPGPGQRLARMRAPRPLKFATRSATTLSGTCFHLQALILRIGSCPRAIASGSSRRWATRLGSAHPRVNYAASAYDFAGPLVESDPLSETERLAFDYIAWLRTASPEALEDQLHRRPPSRSTRCFT